MHQLVPMNQERGLQGPTLDSNWFMINHLLAKVDPEGPSLGSWGTNWCMRLDPEGPSWMVELLISIYKNRRVLELINPVSKKWKSKGHLFTYSVHVKSLS